MEIKAILNKPYTDEERIEFIVEQNHKKGYELNETETSLEAWGNDSNDLLEIAKFNKIQENDNLRDIALNQGVVYKNILFDSDTDQKVNLLAITSSMDDEMTVPWYGMNNNVLIATKEDLENIGGLITQLHTFCWTKNAETKEEINNAETKEEVEAIEIDYGIEGEK